MAFANCQSIEFFYFCQVVCSVVMVWHEVTAAYTTYWLLSVV